MNKIQMAKMAITKMAGRSGLIARKHGPEILIVTGIVGLVTSTVMACRATRKADEVLDKAQYRIEQLKDEKEIIDVGEVTELGTTYVEYPNKIYRKNMIITYTQTGVKLVKIYAPAVTLGVASVACILGAHNIMKRRNVALAAAYKAVEQGFASYRRRVVDELGEEKDREFRYGIKKEQVTEIETDEDGKKRKVKKTIETADPNGLSVYARWFDEACDNWSKTPEYNKLFLVNQQRYANDMLHSRGHLFLNEVYDMLGLERSQAGAVVGWVVDKDGDNYVDFGIYNKDNIAAHYFVNGTERSILLDFNVNGVIYDLI